MGPKTVVPVEEYLRMSFDGPDREYVDGEIVERSLPDNLHAETQWRLSGITYELSKRIPLHGRTELRSRVAATRIRIPDVSVYAGERPTEAVPSRPPLIAIEIVSPDDRHQNVLQKLEEYRVWGAPHVWLANPYTRQLHIYADGVLRPVSEFKIPEYGVTISPDEIFG